MNKIVYKSLTEAVKAARNTTGDNVVWECNTGRKYTFDEMLNLRKFSRTKYTCEVDEHGNIFMFLNSKPPFVNTFMVKKNGE